MGRLFSFGQDKRWTKLYSLQDEIDRLKTDVARIEAELGVGEQADEAGSVYRYVKRLRSSMAEEELVEKRDRLEKMVAEAKALEATLPDTPPPPRKPRVPRPRPRLPVVPLAAAGIVVLGLAILGSLYSMGYLKIGGFGQSGPPVFSTVEFLPRMESRPVNQIGEVFYTRDLEFNYAGGSVILSGEPPPTGEFWVDDTISLSVRRPDGSTQTWRQDFNAGCFQNRALPPQEVGHLFLPGRNVVTITLSDACGAFEGTSGPITLSTPQK